MKDYISARERLAFPKRKIKFIDSAAFTFISFLIASYLVVIIKNSGVYQ